MRGLQEIRCPRATEVRGENPAVTVSLLGAGHGGGQAGEEGQNDTACGLGRATARGQTDTQTQVTAVGTHRRLWCGCLGPNGKAFREEVAEELGAEGTAVTGKGLSRGGAALSRGDVLGNHPVPLRRE